MSRLSRDPRQLEAAHPGTSAWVSANAGAGKTQVLSNRIARLLLAGAEPSSILCLTYTKAAAAEMATRIHDTLGGWASLDDKRLRATLQGIGMAEPSAADLKRARQLFALALDTPGGFKIQTIHGFCERILQLFPVEAGMAPGFEVLDDSNRTRLINTARDDVLGAARTEPGSELADALQLVGQYATSDSLNDLVKEMQASAAASGGWSGNHHAGMIEEGLRSFLGIPEHVSRADIERQICSGDDAALRELAQALIDDGGANNGKHGRALLAVCKEMDPAKRVAAVKEQLFLDKQGKPRKPLTVSKTRRPELQQQLQASLSAECERLLPLLQQHDALLRIEATKALSMIAGEILRRYEAAKAERAAYDFDDLIERTRRLLSHQASTAWVLYKLDKTIQHVLVDEAQDTSPPQWQILKAATEEFYAGAGREQPGARTFFVVGDQKQSIFSFQGADVRVFAESQAYFAQRSSEARQSMKAVPLTISYRSQEAVLQAVDRVFEQGMPARQCLGIAESEGLLHQQHRPTEGGLVELWPLLSAGKAARTDIWRAPREVREQSSPQLQLARKIAATIASWIGRRWLRSEKRAVQPSDILLLFRRRSRMFGMMIAALRERGVPVAGADRLKPAENIAVQDMLALMRIMTLPEDDYELACVLKSPLVSRPLSEEELFGLCHAREGARLWTRLAASTEPAASTCFSELSEWRRLALECRPYEFISRVLMRRKPDILARLGGEADDALQALSEQALAYEREHGASLSGFAEWFRSEKTEIRRDMDSGQGEVRLMTVHGAKGLEANIVMLPDAADFSERDRDRLLFVAGHGGAGDIPLWKLSGLMPSPSIDALKAELQAATQSEYTRLLYVAMTRARDELYICGAHEKDEAPKNSWYGMASAALSTDGFMRLAGTAEAAPVLRLGSDPEWMEKPDGPASRAETNKLPDCLGQAFAAAAAQPDLTPSRISNPGGRTFDAGAARAGRIYHRILELLPDKPAAERRGFVERKLAQAGLGGDYAGRLLTVLELPELEALFGEGSSGETGIGSRLADGRALHGVIDRLAVRDTEILLLDYKSDAQVPERTGPDHRHFRQMAGYCSGLQKMHPGKTIKAGILWLSRLRLDWLDPAEMAGAIAALEGQRELPKP